MLTRCRGRAHARIIERRTQDVAAVFMRCMAMTASCLPAARAFSFVTGQARLPFVGLRDAEAVCAPHTALSPAWTSSRRGPQLSMHAGKAPLVQETAQLSLLRTEAILAFDTRKYPFAETVRAVLRIPEEQALDALHEVTDWHTEKNGNRVSAFQKLWNADRDRMGRELEVMDLNPEFEEGRKRYTEFEELYQTFIQEVIAPGLGGGAVQYQRAPTLRVMVPAHLNTRPADPVTVLHNDMEYHHQPSEINFWLPLTSVRDTNTLWLESMPGLGDLHPLNIEYGQFARFYGNQCRHTTKPNATGKTRVSLDFRAVSNASGGHDPTFRKGRRRGAKARFQYCFDVGGYYNQVSVQPSYPEK